MNGRVIKRDGSQEDYDRSKIMSGISAACREGGISKAVAYKTGLQVAERVKGALDLRPGAAPTSYIQKLAVKALEELAGTEVSRLYRWAARKRELARGEAENRAMDGIFGADLTYEALENANIRPDTPSGIMWKTASARARRYAFDRLLSDEAKKAVEDNLIHVHDMDMMPARTLTCVQHPLDRVLSKGIQAGQVEYAPATDIESAVTLSLASLRESQNVQHGGQAIPAFDFFLAPYVRMTYEQEVFKLAETLDWEDDTIRWHRDFPVKEYAKDDSLSGIVSLALENTRRRVRRAMSDFVHGCNNSQSRYGGQCVFASVNFGTDTSAEGRCVIREFLGAVDDGVGGGSTAIFPISIMKLKKGVNKNPEDPSYDLFEYACRVTARRFFPNFLNLDAEFNRCPLWEPDDPERWRWEPATMGCRTRVFEGRHCAPTSIGRGNLSFTSINLPRIALSVRNISDKRLRLKEFYKLVKQTAEIAGRQLYDRYLLQCAAPASSFPLLMGQLWMGSEELPAGSTVAPVLKYGTLGIGFIGLAEALTALTSKHHGESEESQKIGLETIGIMKKVADAFSIEHDLNFAVLATPAEGLAGKFLKKDRDRYGEIEGVTDRGYYTNSNHVPVYYRCGAWKKARIEGPYHRLTLGGHIFYVEFDGDPARNVSAVISAVKMMDKCGLGYMSVNHNRNRCMDCGYEDAEKDLKQCPRCGSKNLDTIQRITGYLVGATRRWNPAKLAELRDRTAHVIRKEERDA